MMENWTHITVFTDEYPADVQAEGLAVSRCVATGLCNRCMYLKVCSTNESFKPPVGAFCIEEKKKILEGKR